MWRIERAKKRRKDVIRTSERRRHFGVVFFILDPLKTQSEHCVVTVFFYHGSSIRVGERILTHLKTPRIYTYIKCVGECWHSSLHWILIIPSVLRIWIGCCCRLVTRIVSLIPDR